MQCIEVTTGKTTKGYGHSDLRFAPGRGGRVSLYAHRVAFTEHWGPIPPGLVVRHSCDNPGCVNPLHLMLGTVADNQRDMVARRRHHTHGQTHCKRGHELAGDNLIPAALRQGRRDCRACARARDAARYAARVA